MHVATAKTDYFWRAVHFCNKKILTQIWQKKTIWTDSYGKSAPREKILAILGHFASTKLRTPI